MTDHITTDRLVLRPPVMADAQDIARHANDVEVTQWLTQLPFPYSESDARDFIANQTTAGTFAMCKDGAVIGCIGTRGEFGYWLGRTHWGQGLTSEAAHAVLERHFMTGGTALQSGHAIGNLRSRRVLLKMGFEDTLIVERTHMITKEVRAQQAMVLTPARWGAVQ